MKALIRSLLPRSIRPRRILAGPLRGKWLVTSWHDYPAGLTGRTERALLGWFASHAHTGQTWIDVGAYCGYTTFALAQLVGPEGRVFAFEPVPATAGLLDRGRALNRLDHVTSLPFGLGTGATFHMRQLFLTCGMGSSTPSDRPRQESVQVSIARFDWLWPLINGGHPAIHGIKMDVQGMEVDALEGMRETLAARCPHLVVELHAGVSRDRLLSIVRGCGYRGEPTAIEPTRDELKPLFLDDRSYAFTPA